MFSGDTVCSVVLRYLPSRFSVYRSAIYLELIDGWLSGANAQDRVQAANLGVRARLGQTC